MIVDADVERDWLARERIISSLTLFASALLAAVVSFFYARYATLAYLLNMLPPLWRRYHRATLLL